MSTLDILGSIPTGALASSRTASVASVQDDTQPLAAEEQAEPSVRLSLSEYARKRLAAMREATAALRARNAVALEERKAEARQRLEDLKKRIAMLRQLVAGLGPEAAKGALNQLKQLARELGQVAGVLKESSPSGSLAANAQAEQTDAGAGSLASEDRAAVEAEQASAAAAVTEAGTTETEAQSETEPDDAGAESSQDERASWPERTADTRQRQADADELKKVARQLESLLAMVKAQLKDAADPDARHKVDEIETVLESTKQTASAMQGAGVQIIGISVSV